ncbi:hypothetical protein FSO04_24250 [Paraburkholderia madseniana]|uniref:Uncharacterized protein n=1 Tax=Paraburkholderia madseniana TaxID=2599607 RepID=A0A6N6W9K2_9BURK|nr:hypothetical protein [Paraburkholderia madseniana]KAE8757335.1 hypothetical protein FSO04_24250 [Paraburkholderia madseniana]
MQHEDFENFSRVLDAAYSLHSKSLTADARALFFAALGKYSLADVRKAFSAHISDPQRGQFPPRPADLIAQLVGDATKDGRPEAAEAWAIAVRSRDEAETVCWTQEMAEAFAVASNIENDEFGARTAFTSRYNRLVEDARATGRKVSWFMSYGHDASRREAVALEAVRAGHLQLEHARKVLPQLAAPETGDTSSAREQRAELHKLIANMPNHTDKLAQARAAELEKQRELTAGAKLETAQRVANYEADHG